MHPAFSVIFLTTLIGAAQGLFLALFSGQVYSTVELLPTQADPARFYGIGSLIALILLGIGLLASFFHLGHPERGWRAIARWRTSWLSREVIALPAFMGAVFLYGVVHFFGWNPVLLTLANDVAIDLSLVLGILGTLLAIALFIATGMIYACIKFLQEWATPLTVINYFLLGTASGFTLAAAYAALFGSGMTTFYAGWAIVLTLAGLLTRGASLLRNRRIQYRSTLQTAIGIRHTRIAQKAQGAMGGSFNTREFFHGRTPEFIQLLTGFFLVSVFALPLLLLGIGLAAPGFLILGLAFAIQYLGLIAERWVFFAQARHPQNLYYQTV